MYVPTGIARKVSFKQRCIIFRHSCRVAFFWAFYLQNRTRFIDFLLGNFPVHGFLALTNPNSVVHPKDVP